MWRTVFAPEVRADYLTLGCAYQEQHGPHPEFPILARNPEIAFLWNMADNYSNLLNPELSISCPFILTLTLVVEDQVKRSQRSQPEVHGPGEEVEDLLCQMVSVRGERGEGVELRQRLGSGQSSVVSLPQHHSILQGQ